MTKVKTDNLNADEYLYTACGLNNVIIRGMPSRTDDAGECVIQIPMINLLHANIAFELAGKESGLLPEELKFVRTEMNLTQGQLAERIKKDLQTIGRWERGKNPIDPTAEIVIRLLTLEHLVSIGFIEKTQECDPSFSVQEISAKCVPDIGGFPIRFNYTDTGYSAVAA